MKLIILFGFTEGGHSIHELIESSYGKKMISSIYCSLSASEDLQQFRDFLSGNEFQQVIEIISPNLDCFGPLDLLISKLDDLDEQLVIQAALITILQQMGTEFKIWIRDEADTKLLQKLRSNIFTYLKAFLKKNIEKMEIITNLRSNKQRMIYQDVYSHTIDHYLPKIFDMVADHVIKQEKPPYGEDMS